MPENDEWPQDGLRLDPEVADRASGGVDEIPGVPSSVEMTRSAGSGGRQLAAADSDQSPMGMLNQAIAQGYGPETISQLMELAKDWDQWQARRAFYHAMSAFRANAPILRKDKTVKFRDGNGNLVEYSHVKLPTIVSAVSEVMAPLGLSFRWNTSQLEGGRIRVDCIIRHEDGYEESTGLEAGTDTSGKKNSIQGVGSTVRYLQRYTLEAMTGVVSDDPRVDDDGATGGDEIDGPGPDEDPGRAFLTEQQCADYRSVFQELRLTEEQVCRTYGVVRMEDLRQQVIPDLERRLENRRAAIGAAKSGGAS